MIRTCVWREGQGYCLIDTVRELGDTRERLQKVTIKDVAREAGVNVSTASRALAGSYGVHPLTREKVLRVAERLKYQPNPIARGLVTGHSNTMGVLISDIRNPFFAE